MVSCIETGLSPRVRGNQLVYRHLGHFLRSNPACAGEPVSEFLSVSHSWVYPRVCGGTGDRAARSYTVRGLSPRVRGNPSLDPMVCPGIGSIPACAGEPHDCCCERYDDQVYPRVCGGTTQPSATISMKRGLSPRVRGNHDAPRTHLGPYGSIPACAGEPHAEVLPTVQEQVYPRVCGGTDSCQAV